MSGNHPSRAPRESACEPYRELIVEAVGRGRNAMAIWQDLVDDHGFPAGYASVRRFVSTLRQQPAVEARVVIATAPGEEAQVDYGDGPMVRDRASGKYRRTRLFVLTLGYSCKAVRLLVRQSSTQVWAELHERAFRRLGGSVRVVVLDNLKEGVLTPDIYDPTLNPLYRDGAGPLRGRGPAVPRRRLHPHTRCARPKVLGCETRWDKARRMRDEPHPGSFFFARLDLRLVVERALAMPANKKKDPRYAEIYRDMPGYSGMRPRRLRPMIVGVPPRVGAAYAGIGRRNCGSRLLIHQMAFKPRFPGVLGSLK